MKSIRWKDLGIVSAIVAVNALFVLQLTGIAYEPFSWKAYATVYDGPDRMPDDDGDGIFNPGDPNPNVFDPAGCIYDVLTGEILPGGSVTPSSDGPANISTLMGLDGSTGCYAYEVDSVTQCVGGGNAGQPCNLPSDNFCENAGGTCELQTFSLAIVAPPGCSLTTLCPDLAPPPFNPPASGMAWSLGNSEDAGNPGFLTSNLCTPWYSQIQLDPSDIGVINNNIAVLCERALAPTLSPLGMLAAVLLLLGLSFLSLRRRGTLGT